MRARASVLVGVGHGDQADRRDLAPTCRRGSRPSDADADHADSQLFARHAASSDAVAMESTVMRAIRCGRAAVAEDRRTLERARRRARRRSARDRRRRGCSSPSRRSPPTRSPRAGSRRARPTGRPRAGRRRSRWRSTRAPRSSSSMRVYGTGSTQLDDARDARCPTRRSAHACAGGTGKTTGTLAAGRGSRARPRGAPGRRCCSCGARWRGRSRPAPASIRGRAASSSMSHSTSPVTWISPRTSSASRLRRAPLGRREQHVGEPVGLDAVALLGHVVAKGAQPGLDVQQRQPGRGGGARARQRGVGVAAHEDRVGPLGARSPRASRSLAERELLLARARADAEVVVGRGQRRWRAICSSDIAAS